MKGGCVIGWVIKLEEGRGWTYNWESLEKMELGEKKADTTDSILYHSSRKVLEQEILLHD